MKTTVKFHRRPAVKARYGISDATLYRWVNSGTFPQPVHIGPNTVAWRDSDLEDFDQDPPGWAQRHAGAAA